MEKPDRTKLVTQVSVVFNANNRLLVAGIVGLAGIIPVGTGITLGLVVNYLAEPEGHLASLTIGGGLIITAMVFGALTYRRVGYTDK